MKKTTIGRYEFIVGSGWMTYMIIEQKNQFKVLFTVPKEDAEDTRIIKIDDENVIPIEEIKHECFKYLDNKYIFIKYFKKINPDQEWETSIEDVKNKLWDEYRSWGYASVECIVPCAFYEKVDLKDVSGEYSYVGDEFLVSEVNNQYVELIDKHSKYIISLEQFKICFKIK